MCISYYVVATVMELPKNFIHNQPPHQRWQNPHCSSPWSQPPRGSLQITWLQCYPGWPQLTCCLLFQNQKWISDPWYIICSRWKVVQKKFVCSPEGHFTGFWRSFAFIAFSMVPSLSRCPFVAWIIHLLGCRLAQTSWVHPLQGSIWVMRVLS